MCPTESLESRSHKLAQAYDPRAFRELGKQLVDQLADYLESLANDPDSQPAINYQAPEEVFRRWDGSLTQTENGAGATDWWQQLIEESVHLHHPRYMGHQISPPLPIAALAGMLSDLLNNGMGVYEMGAAATAIERVVINLVAQQFGMSNQSGGFMTSGGTLGNLTALLTARRVKAPDDVWTEGQQRKLAIMVSEQAHYCVDRAARIMGFGADGVIQVPSDAQFRMRTEMLPELYQRAIQRNIRPIAVVGSACTTSAGAFDDLEKIANFCESSDLWFHVDGAHGTAAAFSPKYQFLVQGIDRADSVIMDFHKTMMTPALATALVYRNYRDAYTTFSQQAQYLWDSAEAEEWYELTKRTFECTKYMMCVKVYSILQAHGVEIFGEYVDRCFDLGKTMAKLVHASPHFELATLPDCNIVCFRYIEENRSLDELNHINRKIRQSLLESGQFYIVQTELDGILYLRTTLTNPFTRPADLEALLVEIQDQRLSLDLTN